LTNTSVVRKDVISEQEFQEMLAKADDITNVYYSMRDKALICIFKAFGKRRGELARLEVSDLRITEESAMLEIVFTLEKKRKKQVMAIRRAKHLPLSHPLAQPIVEYWEWIRRFHPECLYLFPRTVYSGLTKQLFFDRGKHLTGRQILRRVKVLNPKSWCHLFRETAGAEIVRADPSIMSAFKVMLRLDLEDEKTALGYVRRYAIDVIQRE